MSKLHELLAVEANLRGQAEACRKDLMNTFEKKRHHFSEIVVVFKSSKEGVPDKVESQLGLQTTIEKELDWVGDKIVKNIDTGYQIDLANCVATADVILDDEEGTVLLEKVPATTLLQLEKRLKEIHELIKAVPTLDPAKGFEPDEDHGKGIYKARDVEKARTEKQFEFVVMVQPSKEHPAQVKEMMVDKPVGTLLQQEWSGLITVGQKADMLDRLEGLLRAVKKARSRANDQGIDVNHHQIAGKLFDYIVKGF